MDDASLSGPSMEAGHLFVKTLHRVVHMIQSTATLIKEGIHIYMYSADTPQSHGAANSESCPERPCDGVRGTRAGTSADSGPRELPRAAAKLQAQRQIRPTMNAHLNDGVCNELNELRRAFGGRSARSVNVHIHVRTPQEQGVQ